MSARRLVTQAHDVDQTLLDVAQDVWESTWDGMRIDDWYDFLDEIERYTEVDLGPLTDTPAIRKIRRHITALRKMG